MTQTLPRPWPPHDASPQERLDAITASLSVLCEKHFENPEENAEYHGAVGRIEFQVKRLGQEIGSGK